VTATRDRRSDPDEAVEPAWDDRPIIGSFFGAPWWGAVALAFVVSAIGAFVDMQREANTLGLIYQIAYIGSCAAAICLVRRRSLFGPMVQPPLVFAVTAVGAIVLLDDTPGASGGLKQLVFSVALPLTSNFPTMAITTGVTVAIGLFRLWYQRDPERGERPGRPAKERPARGRREPDEFDDDPFARPRPGRGERPARDRQAPPPGRGREPSPRRRPPGERSVPPGADPRPGRGERQPRPGREGRPERREPNPWSGRGRGEPPADRAGRGGRARREPPPPRRDGEPPRPRREGPPPGGGGRGRTNPPRPRRRPPDAQR
jgi:uncharacterized protein DUF6542